MTWLICQKKKKKKKPISLNSFRMNNLLNDSEMLKIGYELARIDTQLKIEWTTC